MGFSRQEYSSGLSCPPPGDPLPLQVDSLQSDPLGTPTFSQMFEDNLYTFPVPHQIYDKYWPSPQALLKQPFISTYTCLLRGMVSEVYVLQI